MVSLRTRIHIALEFSKEISYVESHAHFSFPTNVSMYNLPCPITTPSYPMFRYMPIYQVEDGFGADLSAQRTASAPPLSQTKNSFGRYDNEIYAKNARQLPGTCFIHLTIFVSTHTINLIVIDRFQSFFLFPYFQQQVRGTPACHLRQCLDIVVRTVQLNDLQVNEMQSVPLTTTSANSNRILCLH